jgi:hypothetical protein
VSEKDPIRIFVTHAFSESDDYLRVFEFLESVERFFYLNVSKPENIPATGGLEAIKDELIRQIKASEVVVVVSDVLEDKGDLVRYMMDVAEANDINMVSIQPFGGIGETPKDVIERSRDHVEWNERKIVDAVTFQARGTATSRWEVIDFPGFDANGEIESND